MLQNAAKCCKTPQNAAKHHKTPQNAANATKRNKQVAKRRQTLQNPPNAAKRCKTPQNTAKHLKTPQISLIGNKSSWDQIFGGAKKPHPLFRSFEIYCGPQLGGHGPLSPLKTFFLVSSGAGYRTHTSSLPPSPLLPPWRCRCLLVTAAASLPPRLG